VQQRVGHIVGLGDQPAQPGGGQHAPALHLRVVRVGLAAGQVPEDPPGRRADQSEPVPAFPKAPLGGIPLRGHRVTGGRDGSPFPSQADDDRAAHEDRHRQGERAVDVHHVARHVGRIGAVHEHGDQRDQRVRAEERDQPHDAPTPHRQHEEPAERAPHPVGGGEQLPLTGRGEDGRVDDQQQPGQRPRRQWRALQQSYPGHRPGHGDQDPGAEHHRWRGELRAGGQHRR
jgi:hypothetical protein